MDPALLVQSGFALLQRGRLEAAERCAREALADAPGLLPALNLLAIALNAQSRNAEAARAFSELTQREPDNGPHWTNLGTTLRALKRYPEAVVAYSRAAELGERSADFLYNVGLLHIDRGDYEAARDVLGRAHAASPGDPEIAYHYAAACAETLDQDEGLAALVRWQAWPRLDTELVAKIGNVLMNLGDLDGARRAQDRALADPAPSAQALVQLALGLERSNRVETAQQTLEKLRLHRDRPAIGEDFVLAEARLAERAGHHAQAARLYGQLVATCAEPERRHFHQFPLARAHDALGQSEQAFATLLEAHVSQVQWITRTQPEVASRKRETMRVTRFGCDPADVAQWNHEGAPAAAESPVFIVAFPRSGTTLLEHVLDAHPRLKTMDEQPYLQYAIGRLAGPGVDYPARMAALEPRQVEAARAYYWSLVRRRVPLAAGVQLIDKNPLNILRLPAIARLFPNARIVLAVRHPCDVLLSCFMQHFRAEFAWQCRDLETLALAYRRTFDFWYQQAAILRPAVHEVRYETFVAGFEPQVRALAEFLDLPWTDALLEPGENARRRGFIAAPSYAQVVQPVHSRSVGRWHAYERWFEPVLPQLEADFARWDYAGFFTGMRPGSSKSR
jgi:tetratricopeptide (TPR) repeat protein